MTRLDLVVGPNGAGKTSFITSVQIEGRYARLWAVVADAVDRCDTASCWDNSSYDGPAKVAAFTCGELDGRPSWPAWTPSELAARWPLGS